MITPVTNRASELTRTTAEDMNRICSNYNEVFGLSLKTDWTQFDIVDYGTWNAITTEAIRLGKGYGVTVNEGTRYDNLNRIEMIAEQRNKGRRLSFRLSDKRRAF